MKTRVRRIVTAYIVSADTMLLLGMKDPHGGGVYIDSWHNPGGGVEEDETDEQALAREVREECGIDIAMADVRLIDDKGTGEAIKTLPSGEQICMKMRFIVYKVSLHKSAREVALSPTDDLAELRWFPVAAVSDIALTPPAKVLFERIGTDWLFNAKRD